MKKNDEEKSDVKAPGEEKNSGEEKDPREEKQKSLRNLSKSEALH